MTLSELPPALARSCSRSRSLLLDISFGVVFVEAVVFVDAVVSVISFMLLMLQLMEHRKKDSNKNNNNDYNNNNNNNNEREEAGLDQEQGQEGQKLGRAGQGRAGQK